MDQHLQGSLHSPPHSQHPVADTEPHLIFPSEIETLNISPALVVLSSCDSGRGQVKAEGVIGMARAFFYQLEYILYWSPFGEYQMRVRMSLCSTSMSFLQWSFQFSSPAEINAVYEMLPIVFTLCVLVRIPHYWEGKQPPEEYQCIISH